MINLTHTPTAYLRFIGDLTDSIGSFDAAGGTGVALDNNVAGFAHAADCSSMTAAINLNSDIATLKAYTALTVSFWYYHASTSTQTLFSMSQASGELFNGLSIWWQDTTTDRLVLQFDNTSGSAVNCRLRLDLALTQNAWNHIALSCDASGHHLVINGIDVNDAASYTDGSKTTNITPAAITNFTVDSFRIGGHAYTSGAESFLSDGAFARFRIFNTKLSVAQLQTEYAETAQRYKIVGSFGQSNAIGYNDGAILDGAGQADEPDRRILQWGRGEASAGTAITDGAIGLATFPLHHYFNGAPPPNNVGAELAYAKAILSDYDEDYAILIVPSARGSTGFSTDIDSVGGGYVGDWRQGGTYYEDAEARMDAAIATNSTYNEVIAILWNQGESDDNNATFETDLTTFIANFRTDIGVAAAPFLMSGQTDAWIGTDTSRIAIRTSMIAVAAADANVTYHSTVGLENDDEDGGTQGTAHFSADAQRLIGAMYAAGPAGDGYYTNINGPRRYHGRVRRGLGF